jgi:uncharacterized protein (DUF2236 family)
VQLPLLTTLSPPLPPQEPLQASKTAIRAGAVCGLDPDCQSWICTSDDAAMMFPAASVLMANMLNLVFGSLLE